METGYLTALCFAPWTSLRIRNVEVGKGPSSSQSDYDQSEIGSWPLRFLLFKLMLMSGVVKIQAECPTWQNLTALEYHFATQCLPGPLAWHAHQLHPLLLRLGVAATFVIEIPAAFLLICPIKTIRKIGAWLQILLQMLIIFTGNYNFFNLLTISLCLLCMVGENDNIISPMNHGMLKAATFFFFGYCCFQMFELYQIEHPVNTERFVFGLKLSLTRLACNQMVNKTVPISVFVVLAATMYSAIRIFKKQASFWRRLSAISRTFVCCFCIIATARPLYSLTPSLRQPDFFEKVLRSVPHEDVLVSSGYGLFRRMTGVGTVKIMPFEQSYGWAGAQPSVVARPEIIIEAIFEDKDITEDDLTINQANKVWHELNFRWKPGDITHWPKQMAPHQPRFDWRMWFAALGSYQHNPWLIRFLNQILNGCSVALDLLDEPLLASRRVVLIRALLYEYDFTRLDTEWTRGIPNATIIDTSFWSFPEQVWTRKLVQQYLPPIEKNNPSVKQYLGQTGLGDGKCIDLSDRCADVTSVAKLPCQFAVVVRKWNRPCLLSLVVLVLCWALKKRSSISPKRKVKSD